MATVAMSELECSRNQLPHVCVYCGAPAPFWKTKTFLWLLPLRYAPIYCVLALLGVFPLLIAIYLLAPRMSVTIPLCPQHRDQGAASLFLVVVGTLLAVVGLFIAVAADEVTRPPSKVPIVVVYFVAGAFILGGLALAIVASFKKIGARKITRDEIRLRGVHPAFIAALEQKRAASIADPAVANRKPNDDWLKGLPKYGS